MSLFAIADLHLSLGEDKPMDIFAGWNDYTQRLENNWKSIVTDDDTVVIAGDISWAMKPMLILSLSTICPEKRYY